MAESVDIPPQLLQEAVDLLVRRFPDLQAVYLFGSRVTGRARGDSDVDLAILSPRPLDAAVLLDARLETAGVLGRSVDLVDLRRASPILARQILAANRSLRLLDSTAAARFWMVVPSMYEDLKSSRAPIEASIRRRAAHAGR